MWKKLVAVMIGVGIGVWFIDDFNPDAVKGKTVLLTGASTGIGEQFAYHYARLGASIVVTARRENRLKEVVAKCRELGSPDQVFDYVVADMSDLNSTQGVIQEAVTKLGRLDVLVLNHKTRIDFAYWEGNSQNLSLFNSHQKVNFHSYVYLASYAMPHLEASKGSVIVVASFAGKMGQPLAASYSASKFALDGFFSGLRQELKMRNSQVSITLGILGLIGTDSAVGDLQDSGLGHILKLSPPDSPSDAALAMIKAGVSRVREVYFPRLSIQSMVMLRDWCTTLLEYIHRYVYKTET